MTEDELLKGIGAVLNELESGEESTVGAMVRITRLIRQFNRGVGGDVEAKDAVPDL